MGELERRLVDEPRGAGRALEALLGAGAALPGPGVLHVCSSFETERGALRAIRIGPGAPESELDGFVLRAARAQADAIVTTGSILRSEPGLEHGLGDDAVGRALLHHRQVDLGKQGAPLSVVLSHSGRLPEDHPLWRDWTGVLVWTAPAQVARLRDSLPSDVEVVAAREGGAAALLAFLRARGLARVSLEAGPSAVGAFHAQRLVTELWCSRYLALVDAEHRGEPWPFDAGQVESWRVGGSGVQAQASGPWRFDRCVLP